MAKQEQTKFAKPVISSLFFLAAVMLQLYFLRNIFTFAITELPLTLLIELIFTLLTVYGAARSASVQGWGNAAACGSAIVVFAAYIGFDIIHYNTLSLLYSMTLGMDKQNLGLAVLVGKSILILLGLIAAIPIKPQPTQEEYADAFVDAMELQKLAWAKASAKSAKKELQDMRDRVAPQPEEESAEEPEQSADNADTQQVPAGQAPASQEETAQP